MQNGRALTGKSRWTHQSYRRSCSYSFLQAIYEIEIRIANVFRQDEWLSRYLGDGRDGTGDSDSIDSEAVIGRLS